MRHLLILGALVLSVLAPAAALQSSANAKSPSASRAPELLAFRGFHLGGGGGGFHLGGGSLGRHRSGFGGLGRGGSHHVVRRVAQALAFAYLLHLFFSHGGISILIWLLVIGLIVHFVRRGRRRRARYAS